MCSFNWESVHQRWVPTSFLFYVSFCNLCNVYQASSFHLNFFWYCKSPPFHIVIRIHIISLSYHILVILPSHFSSVEQMLMLMNNRTVTNNEYISINCNQSRFVISSAFDSFNFVAKFMNAWRVEGPPCYIITQRFIPMRLFRSTYLPRVQLSC